MKKTIILTLAVILCFQAAIFAQDNQASFEAALAKEGLSAEEYDMVTTYYYQNPQPEKLISVVRAILSQEYLISDAKHFGSFAHLIATAANNSQVVLGELKNMTNTYSGIQKTVIEQIISEAENFQPAQPNSPIGLDYLWAEFMVTGKEEPVKKIISVLASPETKSLEAMLIRGAAEWSLGANAKQHKKVYEIIQKEAMSATGELKTKLESLLKTEAK